MDGASSVGSDPAHGSGVTAASFRRSAPESRAEPSLPRELNLALVPGPGPLHTRVSDSCREAIRAGRLRAGDRLPSTRALAAQLGVSRGVISEAYGELSAGGYIELRDRSAPRVAAAAVTASQPAPQAHERRVRYDFNPLAADLAAFPRGAWMRCTATVMRSIPDAALDYIDPVGHPQLRAELAAYLRRVRSISAGAGQLLITQGVTQALQLTFEALATSGVRRVAIENPSFEAPWSSALRAGLEIVPLPVDGEGAISERLAELDPDAVFLTPAHQFPLGPELSDRRRRAFLDWARHERRYIVEDDYDAEFSLSAPPAPSLQGNARERVIYVGTASKMLAPGLRLGWVVAPGDLIDVFADLKRRADQGSPTIIQLVFAELLRAGFLDRHLRELRRDWRTRRELLLETLRARLPAARISGAQSGSHVTLLLPGELSESRLQHEARRRHLSLYTLGQYSFAEHGHGPGLALGYSALRAPDLVRAVELLVAAIGAASGAG